VGIVYYWIKRDILFIYGFSLGLTNNVNVGVNQWECIWYILPRYRETEGGGGLFLIQENIWGMLLYSVNKFTFLSTQLMYNVLMFPKKNRICTSFC
jgi:hypothetical protein